jgi:cell division protein FtsW (lipid II flippase)
MDNLQHEQYDYARNRIRQKKNVFIHFMIFLVGSFFLYLVNKVLDIDAADNWYIWVITGWAFLFALHFIKVFITDSFMNKNWERHQIDKLVAMQQKKMQKLQAELEAEKEESSL